MMKTQRNDTPGAWPGRAGIWLLASFAVALAAGCASTSDEPIAALQNAEAQYGEAHGTPRIDEFGQRNMREAERNLERARSLAEEGADLDDIEHYSFLAEHHVEIAEARLARGLTQEQIETADRRRQELLLAAESRQSNEARQRAEDAEARLALTQQELQQTQQAARNLAAELDDLKVKQEERGTVFTLSDVVFDVDSDKLKQGGERSVTRIAEELKKIPQSQQILIEGYTDATGSEEYNADLSERRAESVKTQFVDAGIPEDRIRTEGHGEAFPVASNDTPQGRQMNRRVEIVVSNDRQPVEPRGG